MYSIFILVLEHESPAMRKMMQMMQGSAKMEESPPTPTVLEINPDHPVMKGLFSIRNENPELAKLVTEQVSYLVTNGIIC